MKSSSKSSLLEGSLALELWLLSTPLAPLLKLRTASWALLVPGQCLPSSLYLPEISFLPGKALYLPKLLVLRVTRTCMEHLPLAWEEGGHLASGSRGPWSREVQGSPSSHHSSSSAVLLGPSRAPPHPQQRRAFSRDPRLATFRLCVTARPLLWFHEGEVAGEGRLNRLGPERGRLGRGTVVPSSLAPNR